MFLPPPPILTPFTLPPTLTLLPLPLTRLVGGSGEGLLGSSLLLCQVSLGEGVGAGERGELGGPCPV